MTKLKFRSGRIERKWENRREGTRDLGLRLPGQAIL